MLIKVLLGFAQMGEERCFVMLDSIDGCDVVVNTYRQYSLSCFEAQNNPVSRTRSCSFSVVQRHQCIRQRVELPSGRCMLETQTIQ